MIRSTLLAVALSALGPACAATPRPLHADLDPSAPAQELARAAQQLVDTHGDAGLAALAELCASEPMLHYFPDRPALAVYTPETRWLELFRVGRDQRAHKAGGIEADAQGPRVERLLGLPREDGGCALVLVTADGSASLTYVLNPPELPSFSYVLRATPEQLAAWERLGEHPGPFDPYGRHADAASD